MRAKKIFEPGWMRALILLPFWAARFFYYAVRERSLPFLRFYPGYHGSTIPSGKFLARNRARIFNPAATAGDGINLNRDGQRLMLEKLTTFYPGFTPPAQPSPGRLYHYDNPMFGFSDAFVLYGVFRSFEPRRVIEIGSGFSSALMLDISKDFLPSTRFTFIDPYSETIRRVLHARPEGNYELLRTEIQDVDAQIFSSLEAGDVLFIDTSHTVKIASDLCSILFGILPVLKTGVLVHIHDIVFPWEYPEEMVSAGRSYNELYFVRAFLQYNNAFEILFNSSQMERECHEHYMTKMPGYFKDAGQTTGQSLWLRKLA